MFAIPTEVYTPARNNAISQGMRFCICVFFKGRLIVSLSHEPHEEHVCGLRSCPLSCQLCKRLCAHPDHLHGLDSKAVHLCGYVQIIGLTYIELDISRRQEHPCQALCAADGICQIETTPQEVKATFTGRHESFEYTKVRGRCRSLLGLALTISYAFQYSQG